MTEVGQQLDQFEVEHGSPHLRQGREGILYNEAGYAAHVAGQAADVDSDRTAERPTKDDELLLVDVRPRQNIIKRCLAV